MFHKFKLVIEYDGSDYHGWQRQKDEPTIQKAVEDALRRMTNQDVSVIASGRTDSGVHAQNQVAHFAADTKLTGDAFLKGLNSLTPGDIVVKACQPVADSFHARYGVSSKIYDYHIFNHPTPTALFRRHTWHVRKRLDLAAIQEAMVYLEGSHDFSAFEAKGSGTSHPVRTIFSAGIVTQEAGKFVIMSIEGSGFLRCMVRNLVGTLVDVGLEKTSPQAFYDILKSKDRSKAGATAPARGLFLRTVKYGTDTPGMEPLAISSRVL